MATKRYMSCKLCGNIFEDPIILPCFKTACSKHVYLETIGKIFKCGLCKNDHVITKDRFPTNEEMVDFINDQFESVSISKKANELCEEFSKVIEKFQALKNDSKSYICEYFNKIKADANLSKERYIKIIDDHFCKVEKKIDDTAKKCETFQAKNLSIELDQAISVSKANLTRLKKLSTEINDDKKWNDFQCEVEKNILAAEYNLDKFEKNLLNHHKYEFKPNESLNDLNFGNFFETENKHQKEDKRQAKIRFKIENLDFVKHQEFKVIKAFDLIANVPWFLLRYVSPAKFGECELNIVIRPELKNTEQKILAHLKFKVLKLDGSFSKDIVFESNRVLFGHHEDRGELKEFTFYCSSTQLTNKSYTIFNQNDSSVQFEIDINVLKVE